MLIAGTAKLAVPRRGGKAVADNCRYKDDISF